jgi:outer membrane protein assembly factor BamB
MNGSLLWTYTTEDALWGTPTKDGEVVFLPGMDHQVYALNAQTGRLVWKTDSLGGSVAGTPSLSPDGQLYVGTFANELLSLNSEDGQINWHMPAANWVWAGPAQDGGTLYVGDLEGNFYSVNADTGTIAWKIQPDPDNESAIVEKPLVIEDTVYFTSENGFIYAVDAANGNPRWSKDVGGKLYAGPVSAVEIILVAPLNADELLVAFDPNGVQKWVFIPAE